MPALIEVALRARLFGGNRVDEEIRSQHEEEAVKESKIAATELLDLLEKKIGSSALLGQYAEIQRRLQATKAEKKRVLASEAVMDPKGYAVRKVCTYSEYGLLQLLYLTALTLFYYTVLYCSFLWNVKILLLLSLSALSTNGLGVIELLD